ncbi:hypothetical protein [Methylobacterium nonmethylotrophicum]|uniref:Uncharacterized protein n=1 Tax=Methylobacterium nonmethylotrophicum TaxID=1141884 RepID=A0A4Z0NKA9_9HYPH|nr:hypothetical protein [Methylobacterium nonmethylotrophicum]TGD96196.1 hypothetical protein EU555_24900 [Methylobacterium nonmethylotrophicum]
MKLFRIIRARWLTRGACADHRRAERQWQLAEAYMVRARARLDVAGAILEDERIALTHAAPDMDGKAPEDG